MSENDIPGTPVESVPATLSNDERTWALIGHLSAFSAFVTGIGCILGPLVVWLIKRDTLPFAGEQAKEALNFNITVALAFVALWGLTFITFGIGIVLTGPLMLVIGVAWIVLVIVAAIKANEGVAYRYPMTLRLVN